MIGRQENFTYDLIQVQNFQNCQDHQDHGTNEAARVLQGTEVRKMPKFMLTNVEKLMVCKLYFVAGFQCKNLSARSNKLSKYYSYALPERHYSYALPH